MTNTARKLIKQVYHAFQFPLVHTEKSCDGTLATTYLWHYKQWV